MNTIEVVEDSFEVVEVIEAGPKGDKGDVGLSLPDAPEDNTAYARKNGEWYDINSVGLKSGYIGGELPLLTRINDTQISIGGGTFIYANLTGIPPVVWSEVIMTAIPTFTITVPTVGPLTYVYIDLKTMTLLQSDIVPAAKPSYYSYLGNVDFIGGVINQTRSFIETAHNAQNIITNLMFSRGDYNLQGCDYGAGGLLTLSHTAGKGVRIGANTKNDIANPDIVDTAEDEIGFIIRAFKNNAGDFIIDVDPTDVDPTQYVDNGVLSSVQSTKWTVQYIYHFYGSNNVVVYYGTAIFNNALDAKSSIVNPPTGIHQITKEASIRAALIVKGSATDLTDIAQAEFFDF